MGKEQKTAAEVTSIGDAARNKGRNNARGRLQRCAVIAGFFVSGRERGRAERRSRSFVCINGVK